MKRILLTSLAAAIVLCGLQPVSAQPANAERAEKITAARKANGVLMHQYSWQSRTEVMNDGKVADIRIDQVMYGPNNQLQRTVLNDQGAKMPSGFLRRKIAEKKEADMKKYFEGLHNLLDQYTLPTAGKVLDFLDQASIQAPDGNGLLELTGSNVVQPGDQFSVWVQASDHQMSKMQINTFLEGDEVTATVTFKTLTSGLNHMEFAEVQIPAKNISIQVQNYNYVNQNN
jgi:hypothetical protein